MPSSNDQCHKVKRKSKPQSYSDLIHDVPQVLSSKNAQYNRMQSIGSVSDVIQLSSNHKNE